MPYTRDLKQALISRQLDSDSAPELKPLMIGIFSLVGLYVVASLILVPTGEVPEFNFVDERGSITVLSAVFLAMGCAFAFTSTSYSQTVSTRLFWLGFCLALGFLSMDELLEFHERIGGYLDKQKVVTDATSSFRNSNDLVVIAYGAIALVVLMFFLPTALQYPRFLELFALAFSFYVIHTVIDSTQEPPTTVSIVFEETAKLLCSATLALTQFVGTVNVLNQRFNDATAVALTDQGTPTNRTGVLQQSGGTMDSQMEIMRAVKIVCQPKWSQMKPNGAK